MLKTIARVAQAKPGLRVPERTGLLAVSAGRPRRKPWRILANRVRPLAGQVRVRRRVRSTLTRSTGLALAVGPQVALDRAALTLTGGPGMSPQQQRTRAQVLLAGDVGLMALGVLAQRTAIHGPSLGPVNEVGRTLGRQLAIGGLAGSVVLGTDMLLGERLRGGTSRAPVALMLGGGIATAQALVVRRAGRMLTLAPPTQTWTVPVVRDPRAAGLLVQLPRP